MRSWILGLGVVLGLGLAACSEPATSPDAGENAAEIVLFGDGFCLEDERAELETHYCSTYSAAKSVEAQRQKETGCDFSVWWIDETEEGGEGTWKVTGPRDEDGCDPPVV